MKSTLARRRKSSTGENLSEKLLRMRTYSCVFCDFIQANLFLEEEEGNEGATDRVFEIKYLFHLRTVHGLEK
jgi:hypothetical protein